MKRANYGGNQPDMHHFFHHLHNEAMEAWGMAFSLCVCVCLCVKLSRRGFRSQPDDVMAIKEVAAIKEAIELRAQCHFQ